MKTMLRAAALTAPDGVVHDAAVLLEDEIIVAAGSRDTISADAARELDFGDGILCAGLIDVHMHGAAGHDVMQPGRDSLAVVERFIATHGVTSYLPTTVTAPIDSTLRALAGLADAIERGDHGENSRAVPLGIHLEGPFLSHARRGVHPENLLQLPSSKLFRQFWEAARGRILMMTIAPELPNALELIAEASALGVRCSLGHSDANLEQANAGIRAGARHSTHTFNAMRTFDHRDPGIIGAVLTDDRVRAELIADGIHVEPAAITVLLRCKGRDGVVLVTDATSATGMPPGRYRLGDLEVEVSDGRCTYHGNLAGSVLTLDRAVRNVATFGGWPLQDALKLATANPAAAIGMTETRGRIAPQQRADLIVLSPDGHVRRTIVGGRLPD
jgi:N-acetylglucosamine-6-phosphate deacetylase